MRQLQKFERRYHRRMTDATIYDEPELYDLAAPANPLAETFRRADAEVPCFIWHVAADTFVDAS